MDANYFQFPEGPQAFKKLEYYWVYFFKGDYDCISIYSYYQKRVIYYFPLIGRKLLLAFWDYFISYTYWGNPHRNIMKSVRPLGGLRS